MRIVLLVALLFISTSLTSEVSAQEVFQDYVDNPVFSYSGVSGAFDKQRVYTPDVIKVGGEYWMYYSGVGRGNSVEIGLATSSDGLVWGRSYKNPVFTCSDNLDPGCRISDVWSSYRVGVVSVEHEDSLFKMWYFGNNQNIGPYYELGYATSPDGLNWTAGETNPVFDADELPAVTYISVIKVGSGYRLYYIDKRNLDFYYTESTDGIVWSGDRIKISDRQVHSVEKVGDLFLAMDDQDIAVSADGVQFDFESSRLKILDNTDLSHSRVSLILDGDTVKSWRAHNFGNILWRYGNFGINYATTHIDNISLPEKKFPLYTQIKSSHPSDTETASWAGDKFARGEDDSAFSNCPTISACGCTITSIIMLARSYGVTVGVDGSDVNPGNFNKWLIGHKGYDSAGNLKFVQASKYFGVKEGEVYKSYFAFDDDILSSTSVKERVGNGVPTVSRMVAKNNDGTVIPTHFVLITELLSGEYQVNDPLWYNTKTLNDAKGSYQQAYSNKITNGRDLTFLEEPVLVASRFEASLSELADEDEVVAVSNSVSVSEDVESGERLNSVVEMYLLTPGGDKVGFDPVSGETLDIEDAEYWVEGVLQDPFSETPYDESETKMLSASKLSAGIHRVYVIGVGSGTYEFSGLVHDVAGKEHSFSFVADTVQGLINVYEFDVSTGEMTLVPVSAELILDIIDGEIGDVVLNRFFKQWANKIFAELNEGKVKQATQHIGTFKKLMKAKKVESEALLLMLVRMEREIE